MDHLFSIEGPLLRALSDLTTLVVLNMLTILCSIPIVTAGAAFTALHYEVMKMAEGEGHPIQDYFRQFKENLKSATPVWLFFLAAAVFAYVDFRLFAAPKEGAFSPMLVTVYILLLLLTMLFVWIFPLMARIENTFGARFKNAALLAIGHLPRTLAMVFVYALAAFVFTQEMRLLPIAFVLGISLPTYLCVLLYLPVMKEVIGRMKGTKVPEEIDEEEVVQKDENTGTNDDEGYLS
ncbi:MAG: DUF624 domain-containing protein [Lachnospiraceae bacterium]|nr:DUF624 domain-containing protein [Lachnospiraceae bacterium]